MIEKYLDSEELKRLLSTLVAVIGCLIIAALFGILVVPGLRNANKPATQTGVSPVIGETGWLDPAEFPAEKGREIAPVNPQTLMNASAELLSRGEILYEENCLTCHGSGGRGDGPAAGTMDPGPRNFTSTEGWVNGPDMPGIYRTLKQGIPGSSMAAFDYLTKRDCMALVHYVQSLGGNPGEKGSAQAALELSEELASPGEKTKNRIPVSQAISKLTEEYEPPDSTLTSVVGSRFEDDLLARAIVDPLAAAQALRESPLWRNGPEELARAVLPGAPDNGFQLSTATWTPDEWKTLYEALLKRLRDD